MADRAARRAVELAGPGMAPGGNWPPGSDNPRLSIMTDRGSPFESQARDLAERMKTVMWHHAAIVRSDQGLETAWRELTAIESELQPLVEQHPGEISLLELRNMMTVARLVVRSAQMRKESRGLHYNTDYPGRDDVHFQKDTVITRDDL